MPGKRERKPATKGLFRMGGDVGADGTAAFSSATAASTGLAASMVGLLSRVRGGGRRGRCLGAGGGLASRFTDTVQQVLQRPVGAETAVENVLAHVEERPRPAVAGLLQDRAGDPGRRGESLVIGRRERTAYAEGQH